MFKPGSSTAQSSDSESNARVSSKPWKVNAGAVEDETSTLKMKSLAPSACFGGSTTTTGVASEEMPTVVIAWSSIWQQSDEPTLERVADSSEYLLGVDAEGDGESEESPFHHPNVSTRRTSP